VNLVLRSHAATSGPTGLLETPMDNATVRGSIAVTGWAIDDVGISQVSVWRDPVSGEAGSLIFIGNAVRVDDSRGDIAAFAPDSPFQYRAGWGYLLLTNFLPNGGDGTFRLHAYATDVEGNQSLLGSKTIQAVNSTSFVPFGAIDTPAQGETISGSNYANFGWVLVRGSARAHPPFGTVVVLVDGAVIGSPGGWTSRSDLTALFPESTYSGVGSALGVFGLNTTAYANGVHTIAWVVTADNGQVDGIGSRFFTIANGSGLTAGEPFASNVLTAPQSLNPGADVGRRHREVGPADLTAPVRARHGYARTETPIAPDALGVRTVFGRTLDRIVVDASIGRGHSYEAYLSVDGRLQALPIGASFDARRGVLRWQPTLGFVGAYDFVIVRDGYARVPVRVVLRPDTGGSRRIVLDGAF
jgi:hypothetical protein